MDFDEAVEAQLEPCSNSEFSTSSSAIVIAIMAVKKQLTDQWTATLRSSLGTSPVPSAHRWNQALLRTLTFDLV
jgi:hypothetical protein